MDPQDKLEALIDTPATSEQPPNPNLIYANPDKWRIGSEILERYTGGLGSAVQRVGPLPPGTYEVRAFSADGRSTKRSVKLDGRAERKVRLRLE